MKQKLCVGLLIGLLFGYTAFANDPSVIPFGDDFETYPEGTSIIGRNGWEGVTNTATVVTNMTYTFTKASYPMQGSPHQKVVMMDTGSGAISNVIAPAIDQLGQGIYTNVYIDTMVRFTRSDSLPENLEGDTGIQAALFVNSNGNLVVYHSLWRRDLGVFFTKVFTLLEHDPKATAEWVRVTITMDYLTLDDPLGWRFFRVQLNNQAPFVSSNGIDILTLAPTGTWFFCANSDRPVNSYLSAVQLSGTGMFDDFVVTNGAPSPDVFWPVVATADDNGIIIPSGKNMVLEGEDIEFDIGAKPMYVVSNVVITAIVGSQTNTWGIGPTNYYAFTNVTNEWHIHVVTAPAGGYTSHGTPYPWLHQYGYTNNYEYWDVQDEDGDGLETWQEYIAGTDPTNSWSVFRVIKVEFAGTTNLVFFYGTPNGAPDDFAMDRATNLVETTPWYRLSGTLPRSQGVNGTNIWVDGDAPSGLPAYYRPVAVREP
ncbi:MAG: hypothetical protein ACUVWX_10415 [Kiritimatiellia bacterium]